MYKRRVFLVLTRTSQKSSECVGEDGTRLPASTVPTTGGRGYTATMHQWKRQPTTGSHGYTGVPTVCPWARSREHSLQPWVQHVPMGTPGPLELPAPSSSTQWPGPLRGQL